MKKNKSLSKSQSQNMTVGIDLGTHRIRVLIAEVSSSTSLPRVVAKGEAVSHGIKQGFITNPTEVTRSLKKAIQEAEKQIGVKIKKAYFSIGGKSLNSAESHGSVAVSRADSEITELDIKKAIDVSEKNLPRSFFMNKKILHTIPHTYVVDGQETFGKIVGTRGLKLEVKTLFVTGNEQHLNHILRMADNLNIDAEDVIASPFSESWVSLSKTEKLAGCILANIGTETVSLVTFEDNLPVALEVFSGGSQSLTHSIALGLKVSIEEAEQIKLGSIAGANYSKKELEKIVRKNLILFFEQIQKYLEKTGNAGLLPAGIILSGGGSHIKNIDDMAKKILQLPARISSGNFPANVKNQFLDSSWATAYGLCILGFSGNHRKVEGGFAKRIKRALGDFFSFVRQYLP